jgi:DNA-binding LacI/PurR family transcriptional regulator
LPGGQISCNINIVKNAPRYLKVLHALQAHLAAGKYRPGKRLPSENELAQQFKVSRPTAARAIRELVNLGLIERRAGSGTYLRTAPTTPTSQRTFGLLVPGLGNTEILDPICNEIARFAQTHHAAVLWGDPSSADHASTTDQALQLGRFYIDRKVDGVFFAPIEIGRDRQKINLQITAALSAAKIPLVLLDRDLLDFPAHSNFDLIGIDNFHAGLTLTSHLLSLGHKNLVFLARPDHPSTTDLRVAGCREAVARSKPSARPARFFSGDPTDPKFVRHLFASPRPDAIICSNDLTAALLMQTLTSALKLSLPRDLAVAGFDDVNYSTLLAVPLTTMRQPCRAIAQAAVQTLMARIEDPSHFPRQILFHADLIIRKSCGFNAGEGGRTPTPFGTGS